MSSDREVLERAAQLVRFGLDVFYQEDTARDYENVAAALEAMAQRCGEPLYLLHCGKIDGDGEQDEWDVEADSWKRVEDFCQHHPGETVSLYAAPPPAIPEGYVLVPKEIAEAASRKLALIGQIYSGDKESRALSVAIAAAQQPKEG